MKSTARNALLILFLCAVVTPSHAGGQMDVTIPGGAWTVTRGPLQLTGAAGTDLDPDEESAANLVDIDIYPIFGNLGNWRLDIRRTDTLWHADLSLYARRTGNGTAGSGSNPSITGGTNYQLLTTTDTSFFSGYRGRTNIPVQLRLTGMSVTLGVNAYRTTITYTLVDT
jgi:hypothetical protein